MNRYTGTFSHNETLEWRETRPGTPYASLAKVICRQHGEEGDWWNKYPEHQSHEEQ